MPAVAAIRAPPVVVLRRDPEVMEEMAKLVEVELVEVELPVMFKLPMIVEELFEINP